MRNYGLGKYCVTVVQELENNSRLAACSCIVSTVQGTLVQRRQLYGEFSVLTAHS